MRTVVVSTLAYEPPLDVMVNVTVSLSVRRASAGTETCTRMELVMLGVMVGVDVPDAGVVDVTQPLTFDWDTM